MEATMQPRTSLAHSMIGADQDSVQGRDAYVPAIVTVPAFVAARAMRGGGRCPMLPA